MQVTLWCHHGLLFCKQAHTWSCAHVCSSSTLRTPPEPLTRACLFFCKCLALRLRHCSFLHCVPFCSAWLSLHQGLHASIIKQVMLFCMRSNAFPHDTHVAWQGIPADKEEAAILQSLSGNHRATCLCCFHMLNVIKRHRILFACGTQAQVWKRSPISMTVMCVLLVRCGCSMLTHQLMIHEQSPGLHSFALPPNYHSSLLVLDFC